MLRLQLAGSERAKGFQVWLDIQVRLSKTQHLGKNEKLFLLWRGCLGADEAGTRQEDVSRMPGDFPKATHTGIPHFEQKRKHISPGHPSRAAQVACVLVPAFA
jgi:hypothetical protein